jgi:hypothetical protein
MSNPEEKPLFDHIHGTMATQLFEIIPGAIGLGVANRRRVVEQVYYQPKSFAELIAENPDAEPIVDAWLQYCLNRRIQQLSD